MLPSERPCTKCLNLKPVSEFYERAPGKLRRQCIACVKVASSEWGKLNTRAKADSARRVRYNLSPERYEQLLKRQNGACAICRTFPPDGESLHCDHDHMTSANRGLLCRHCNLGLGHFFDSPGRLRAAIGYLQAHNPTS